MSKMCTGIIQMKKWSVNGEAGFLMRCQLFEKSGIFYDKLIAGIQRKHLVEYSKSHLAIFQ